MLGAQVKSPLAVMQEGFFNASALCFGFVVVTRHTLDFIF